MTRTRDRLGAPQDGYLSAKFSETEAAMPPRVIGRDAKRPAGGACRPRPPRYAVSGAGGGSIGSSRGASGSGGGGSTGWGASGGAGSGTTGPGSGLPGG